MARITRNTIACEIMEANAHLPMDDVVTMIAAAFAKNDLKPERAPVIYSRLVKAGAAPGDVPVRAAKTVKEVKHSFDAVAEAAKLDLDREEAYEPTEDDLAFNAQKIRESAETHVSD